MISQKLKKLSEFFHIENDNTIAEIEWVKTNLMDSKTGEAIYVNRLTAREINRGMMLIAECFEILNESFDLGKEAGIAEALLRHTWIPIESAPKDGSKIDIYFPDTGRMCDCVYEKGIGFVLKVGYPQTTIQLPIKTATHWMYTPKGPQKNESTKKH